MNNTKRMFLRLFFAGEVVAFAWMYVFSPHGLKAVIDLGRDNQCIEQTIAKEQEDIVACEHELHVWQTNSFYKEKRAREQLQMARDGEQVYYLT